MTREIGDVVEYSFNPPGKAKGPFTIAGYVYYEGQIYYVGVNDQGQERDLHHAYTIS